MPELNFTMNKNLEIIGMIHIPPLPGSPKYDDTTGLSSILSSCIHDLDVYLDSGINGTIFENFGDVPFFPSNVPPETIASMTWIITKCIDKYRLKIEDKNFKIGINVLRNDPIAALAIAKAVNADFIRVNIHSGTSSTDQGIIEGKAHETMRYRKKIESSSVEIMADVRVKHANSIYKTNIVQESIELVKRGLVDGGLIFTGSMTGSRPDKNIISNIPIIKKRLPNTKIYIGSGINKSNIKEIIKESSFNIDGFIIGTAFKENQNIQGKVVKDKIHKILDEL
ncbi:MAG: BtpA/SgcQ family protein [Promethearchaeota archaeon]